MLFEENEIEDKICEHCNKKQADIFALLDYSEDGIVYTQIIAVCFKHLRTLKRKSFFAKLQGKELIFSPEASELDIEIEEILAELAE